LLFTMKLTLLKIIRLKKISYKTGCTYVLVYLSPEYSEPTVPDVYKTNMTKIITIRAV